MSHPVLRLFVVIAFLAGAGSVSAHSGFENETEIRLFADRMDVNIRTTYGFAWKILGHRAPNDIGEDGQRVAGPLLVTEAPGLLEVTSGGKVMAPRGVDCQFELDEHVVFLLTYDRPAVWPLGIKARFFDSFDPLTTGTVRVFDQTDDPFRRDIDPLAEGRIYRGKPAFTYHPAPLAEVVAPPPAPPVSAPPPTAPREEARSTGFHIGWVAGTAVMLLVLVWWLRCLAARRARG